MEARKTKREQKYQMIKSLKIDDPIRIRERAQLLIDEIQKELDPENIISRLRMSSKYELGFYANWNTVDSDQLARLKMELDKLTNFTHAEYPDQKKNLSHGMLHKVHDLDAERCLLKMFTSKNHKESDFPLMKLEEQDILKKIDRDSVLSKKEIQKKIQVLEKRREEAIKVIMDRRKKLESIKREITRARPCSPILWGGCSHPQVHEFDPLLWGMCGCTCRKPLSKKNRETIITTMKKMQTLREKLESIREQRQRVFLHFYYLMNDF